MKERYLMTCPFRTLQGIFFIICGHSWEKCWNGIPLPSSGFRNHFYPFLIHIVKEPSLFCCLTHSGYRRVIFFSQVIYAKVNDTIQSGHSNSISCTNIRYTTQISFVGYLLLKSVFTLQRTSYISDLKKPFSFYLPFESRVCCISLDHDKLIN